MSDYLTSVQRDCIDRKGTCEGCPNNILESQACLVKYSKLVAPKLGLEPIKPKGVTPEPIGTEAACAMCDADYIKTHIQQKTCKPCGASKRYSGQNIKRCKACGTGFWGSSGAIYCLDCREREIA